MRRVAVVAATIALLLPGGSSAAGGSIDSASYAEVGGRPGVAFSVSWSLSSNEPVAGAIEYSCGLLLNGAQVVLVDPRATSSAGSLQAAPGSTVTVTIQTVIVTAATTLPENACFQPRTLTTLTLTAPAAPAPPPPPPSAAAQPSEPSPPPAEPGPTIEERVAALETKVVELAAKDVQLQAAMEAAWTAMVDALAAGAPPWEAALAARSAGLNVLYGLGGV